MPLEESPVEIEKPHEIIDIKPQEDIIDIPKEEPVKKDNSAVKAAAILTGVGAAAGGIGYAAHKYMKSKEEPEDKNYDENNDY